MAYHSAPNQEPEENGDEGAQKPPRPGKELRTGFSTGTAAAAAAKAALWEVLNSPGPAAVEVPLPGGGSLTIAIEACRRPGEAGEAVVIKDAGDDPDVTHGAAIGARVRLTESKGRETEIVLRGGAGVGRVTKPGLLLPVGEPAINPVPRRMIRRALQEVWDEHRAGEPPGLAVEIFVPRGEELARHTLNPRLGILGGISILGTTGLVKPFSHAAYRATILASLRVARALGLRQVVFSTGGKSEGFIQAQRPELPVEAFVQMGDYVSYALKAAKSLGFREIGAAAFFGKALKMAQGWGHTHASRGLVNLVELGRWSRELTGNKTLAREVAGANTARQALEILSAARAGGVIEAVGGRMLAALRQYAGAGPALWTVMLDFNGAPLWQGASPGSA